MVIRKYYVIPNEKKEKTVMSTKLQRVKAVSLTMQEKIKKTLTFSITVIFVR
jgi:hypothetical protein